MSQKGAISGPGNHQKGREILYALSANQTCQVCLAILAFLSSFVSLACQACLNSLGIQTCLASQAF